LPKQGNILINFGDRILKRTIQDRIEDFLFKGKIIVI